MTIARGRTAPASRNRRNERAVAVFGTWMIIGLFLDGWSHQANKPETFFSPWHLLLYSGFVAAVAWFGWDGRRRGDAPTPGDRWLTAGLVLFVTGAVGDGIWHEVLLLGSTMFVLRRWDPPPGAVVVEVARRRLPLLATVALTSVALWSTYFAVVEVTVGLLWTVELWSGSIVLAAASSSALVALNQSRRNASVG